MMGIETIRHLQNEAARSAKRNRLEPWHPNAHDDFDDIDRVKLPFLGTFVPKGWEVARDNDNSNEPVQWFCDISGFGRNNEPALSQSQLLRALRAYYETHPQAGFALVEHGQFQGYVQAFHKKVQR